MMYLTCEHPRHIDSAPRVKKVIEAIQRYEQETGQPAGVVLQQNTQLGGLCKIVSEGEAREGMARKRVCEWYVKFWPRSYFEELRAKIRTK